MDRSQKYLAKFFFLKIKDILKSSILKNVLAKTVSLKLPQFRLFQIFYNGGIFFSSGEQFEFNHLHEMVNFCAEHYNRKSHSIGQF